MRKILSVILAVVMLAAMFVMPTNAAEEIGLVITEINVNTGYTGKDGSSFRTDTDDVFEFIEVYNASDKSINLYDYSLAFTNKIKADNFDATANFTKFTPIASANTMKELGVKGGNICSSATNLKYENTGYYPINEDELAIVKPGETAIIWLYTADAYSVAALMGGHTNGTARNATYDFRSAGVPFDFFKDYYGITDDITIVAVDANAEVALDAVMNGTPGNIITGKSSYGEVNSNYKPNVTLNAEKYAGPNGTNKAETDLFTAKYPSADGRFQLKNNVTGTVALVKSEKFEAVDALNTVTVADAETYATYSYSNKEMAVADKSNNYVAGVEYAINVATPGALLDTQAKALASIGYPAKADVKVVTAIVIDEIISVVDEKVLYEQDFEGTAPTFTLANKFANAKDAIAEEWIKVDEIDGNKVLKIYKNQAFRPVIVQLISSADMLNANGDNMYSDFHLSYKIKFGHYGQSLGGLVPTDAHVGVTYNYDGALSYDMFALTVGGYGLNVNRHQAAFTTVDADSDFFAGAKDSEGKTSIINRITNGRILSADQTSGALDAEANRFNNLGEWVDVDVYFSWENGSTVYVNGAKVSQATDASNNEWTLDKKNFGIGVYAYPTATAYIDDIKMVTCDADDLDLILDNNSESIKNFETSVPATGDATLYVVVAMAVAFVALAAVVIIRRNKATN